MTRAAPTFGKRNRPLPSVEDAAVAEAQAAFFKSIRIEAEATEGARRVVPRSFRAALLAGLVVGCGLAGLDATRNGDMLRHLSDLAGDGGPIGDPRRLLPVLLVLGLLGGARAAAANLLVAHWVLRRVGWTHPLADAGAGAVVAAVVAALLQQIVAAGLIDPTTAPSHGLAIDIAAGAAAGVFYRIFAGTAPA